ncbi:MAG TPA: DUF5995 family protein [Halobacteriales archaeon]|nr:DUF5995 family protein [Halobacteriales archaeon]
MGGLTEVTRLLDGTGVRATLRSLRGDVDQFDPPVEPDPDLLGPVERPFESIPDASERLATLERRLLARGDRRAVFLSIYVRMTEVVHGGLDEGAFADPDWMERYLVTFADYYRRAFCDFERGDVESVPDPWRVAFGAALGGDALVVQDAFLGVNAHINYDLAFTLADVGIDPRRPQKYADHLAINDLLAALVDVQQAALVDMYAEGLGDVDAALGAVDESMTLRSMTQGREFAWRVAVVRADVGIPPVPSYARWVVRQTATGAAFFLLGSFLDPSLRATLRRVEAEGMPLDVVVARVHDRVDDAAIYPD